MKMAGDSGVKTPILRNLFYLVRQILKFILRLLKSNKVNFRQSREIKEYFRNSELDIGTINYQSLLTKAVAHKKLKEWNEAFFYLDEAYKLMAKYSIEHVIHNGASIYLRRPAYLQLSGRNDEGWRELVNLKNGQVPYRGKDESHKCAMDISFRKDIENGMRIFLDKEKNFYKSLSHRCIVLYFSAVLGMSNYRRSEHRFQNEEWKEYPYENQEHYKQLLIRDLNLYREDLVKFEIPELTEKLIKPVKKARLKSELSEKLATLIYNNAYDLCESSKFPLYARESAVLNVNNIFQRIQVMIFNHKKKKLKGNLNSLD